MSNLIATQQVGGGDLIQVGFDPNTNQMTFAKEAEDIPVHAMVQMVEASPLSSVSVGIATEAPPVAVPRRRAEIGDCKNNLAA